MARTVADILEWAGITGQSAPAQAAAPAATAQAAATRAVPLTDQLGSAYARTQQARPGFWRRLLSGGKSAGGAASGGGSDAGRFRFPKNLTQLKNSPAANRAAGAFLAWQGLELGSRGLEHLANLKDPTFVNAGDDAALDSYAVSSGAGRVAEGLKTAINPVRAANMLGIAIGEWDGTKGQDLGPWSEAAYNREAMRGLREVLKSLGIDTSKVSGVLDANGVPKDKRSPHDYFRAAMTIPQYRKLIEDAMAGGPGGQIQSPEESAARSHGSQALLDRADRVVGGVAGHSLPSVDSTAIYSPYKKYAGGGGGIDRMVNLYDDFKGRESELSRWVGTDLSALPDETVRQLSISEEVPEAQRQRIGAYLQLRGMIQNRVGEGGELGYGYGVDRNTGRISGYRDTFSVDGPGRAVDLSDAARAGLGARLFQSETSGKEAHALGNMEQFVARNAGPGATKETKSALRSAYRAMKNEEKRQNTITKRDKWNAEREFERGQQGIARAAAGNEGRVFSQNQRAEAQANMEKMKLAAGSLSPEQLQARYPDLQFSGDATQDKLAIEVARSRALLEMIAGTWGQQAQKS